MCHTKWLYMFAHVCMGYVIMKTKAEIYMGISLVKGLYGKCKMLRDIPFQLRMKKGNCLAVKHVCGQNTSLLIH